MFGLSWQSVGAVGADVVLQLGERVYFVPFDPLAGAGVGAQPTGAPFPPLLLVVVE